MKKSLGIVFLVAVLCAPAAWAQQKDPRLNPPAQPLPPIGADESSSSNPGATPVPAASAGESNAPLTSAQEWSLPGSGSGRNYLLSNLNVHFGADTDSRTSGGISSMTTLGGNVTLQRLWRGSQLQAQFDAGASFFSGRTDNSRYHQDFRISYEKSWRTWSLYVADSVNFSPEGGYGRGFGLGLPGANLGGVGGNLVNLNPLVGPNQTVLSVNSPRIGNTLIGEVRKTLNQRSSMTFGASYGILRFLDGGLIDSNSNSFRVGYNRALSARDTLGVNYNLSMFRYDGRDERNLSNVVHLSYGRLLTGRLSFQVSGGPLIRHTDFGNTTTPTGATTSQRVSWSMNTSLQYRMPQSSIGISYFRAVTEGSGYFLGANTDNVSFSVSHQLSRIWRANVVVSYARNQALNNFTSTIAGREFDTWGVRTNFSRPLGRSSRMFFSYGAHYQTTTSVGCTGPTCALSGLRQVFGIGFSFHPGPMALE